jgi:lipopolysaccharide transport protein LptA
MCQNFVTTFVLLLLPNIGFAINSIKGGINIESETLEVFTVEKKAEFLGNVVLTQDEATISSERLTLYFQKNTIKNAIFLNNVRVKTKDQIAYGDKGEYSQTDDTIKLTGNVSLNKGGSKICGDMFTYNLGTKDGKILAIKDRNVVGDRKRIKAKFNSQIKKNVSS